jgi:plasmid stability protein
LLSELRAQARRNNRSLSGELRHILQAHLSGASIDAPTNTEQTKTWNT